MKYKLLQHPGDVWYHIPLGSILTIAPTADPKKIEITVSGFPRKFYRHHTWVEEQLRDGCIKSFKVDLKLPSWWRFVPRWTKLRSRLPH